MKTGAIIYFVLMPLIYEGLLYFSYDLEGDVFYDFKESEKISIIYHIIHLLFCYGIELFYILNLNKITNNNIFSKDFISNGEIGSFITLSIIFIVGHMFMLFILDLDNSLDEFPFAHIIILLLVFGMFYLSQSSATIDCINKRIFDNIDYELSDKYTIELHSLSDGHTTSGNISGRRYYIKGVIEDNYNIYYSFKNEKNSIVIRNLPYSENTVDIFEEENCEKPRIEFFKYSKSYEDLYSEYYNYDIYIPVGAIDGININMD